MAASAALVEAIQSGISPLWTPGGIHELRVLNTERAGTVAGYFDSVEGFAAAAARWSGKAPGVYLTLNPVKPEVHARAHNHARQRAKSTTSDPEIAERRWLPLDFDVVRPKDISSTDAEHRLALERAVAAAKWLIERGIPRDAIVFADSGNGAHLLIRVSLANDEAATDLCRRCAEAVSLHFSDQSVTVDLKTFNAARIWKVYGTLACKGDSTEDRPHRVASLLQVPEGLVECDESALVALAALAPIPPERPAYQGDRFDVEGFVGRHLRVHHESPWNGGRKLVLAECPFNSDHTDRSAVIIEHSSGALSFTCHHNGCAGKGWQELRETLEPRPVSIRKEESPSSGHRPTQPAPSKEASKAESNRPRLATVCMSDVQLEEVQWLWYPYIPRGKFTLMEGDPGTRKSWLALAIATAVSLGAQLPSDTTPRDPAGTLLLAGEDGLGDTVKPRLMAMGANTDLIRCVTGLIREVEEEPMTLSAEGIAALIDMIEEHRPALVVIDPLVAYTSRDVDMNKANEVRSMLRPVTDMAQRLGVAVVALRHLNKVAGSAASYRGQGSIDYFAISRSVLFVGQDKNDPGRSILAPNKSSLTKKGSAQAFRLQDGHNGTQFLWDGAVDMTVEELLATPEEPEQRTQLEEAKLFLADALFDGPVAGREVQKSARDAGVSERTLWRAKAEMKIRATKERAGSGHWMWSLPLIDDSAMSAMSAMSAGLEAHGRDANSAMSAKPPLGGRDGRVGRHGGVDRSQPHEADDTQEYSF